MVLGSASRGRPLSLGLRGHGRPLAPALPEIQEVLEPPQGGVSFATHLPFSRKEEKAFRRKNSVFVPQVAAYEATCRSPSQGDAPFLSKKSNNPICICTQELLLCSSTIFPNPPSSMKVFIMPPPLGPTMPGYPPSHRAEKDAEKPSVHTDVARVHRRKDWWELPGQPPELNSPRGNLLWNNPLNSLGVGNAGAPSPPLAL